MAVNPLLVGAGLIGTAAAVGGGLYMSGILTNEEKVSEQEPSGKPRSKDSDYKADGNKYGQIYGAYLVGLESNNDDGGTWSYNQRYKGSRKPKNSGFERDIKDGETLKAACKRAYEGTANFDEQKITIDGVDFKETEVGKYCSSPGKKGIQTLWDVRMTGERYGNQEQYGGNNKYKSHLVSTWSTSNKANKQFGEEKEAELKTETNFASGSNFQKLKNNKKVTIKIMVQKKSQDKDLVTVREVCGDAHGKKESENAGQNSAYPKEEVFKFCSLTGKAPS